MPLGLNLSMNRSSASRASSLASPSNPSSPSSPAATATPASLDTVNVNGTVDASRRMNGTASKQNQPAQPTSRPATTSTTAATGTIASPNPQTTSPTSYFQSQPTSSSRSPHPQSQSQSQNPQHLSVQASSQPPSAPSDQGASDKQHHVDPEQVRKALEATKLDKNDKDASLYTRKPEDQSDPNSAFPSNIVSRSNSKKNTHGNESSASGLTTPASRAPSVTGGAGGNNGNVSNGEGRKAGPSSIASSGNSNLAPPTPVPPAKLSRESSKSGKVTSRLSRMFQQTNKVVHKDLEAVKDFIEEPGKFDENGSGAGSTNGSGKALTAGAGGTAGQYATPPVSTGPGRSGVPSDRESKDGEREGVKEKEKEKKLDAKKIAAKDALSKRFEVHPDGSHSHHLKAAKRQEKLSDMWRDMFGAGKKKEEAAKEAFPPYDQQLSLMSSWVEQLKSEKDKSGSKKGTASPPASLVDKYGKCQEIVGRGAFGVVRISHKIDPKDSRTERLFAVKEFRRRPQETAKKYQKRLTSEFCISSSLRHPNIIHTLDLMPDAKGDYCAVMEYCAGGDLYTLILAAGKLDVGEADCFFKQIMRGVDREDYDFGNGECFRMAWEKEAHMTAGLCGSAPYIAPEEYVNKEFDPRAVDVWATGVIYMAMRSGRHLWRVAQKDEDEFYQKYLQGRRDEDGYPPIEMLHRARCRNVIYSILDPNPTRRITASQVLKSEWLRDIRVCKAGQEGY
ncbi:hypothetical protein KEM56_007358 [Ascosphaera pollenicola]|nr:hypothetical protein KEM56_007358 [Ascosphaera pollenicola]